MKIIVKVILLLLLTSLSLRSFSQEEWKERMKTSADIHSGADRLNEFLPILKGKAIAVVANQASMAGTVHLVDTLLSLKVKIKCVFAPEHGFRGDAGAGEEIKSSRDVKTGLPVVSLYGKHLKPTAQDLKGVDLVLFDIQDVGARFYTYISTLQYVMEACAEQKKPLIVLDRPNPNGFYVDGPILEKKFASFVGMNPVPIVYGMTIGEYATMLNGEHWLSKGVQCKLKVIHLENYSHKDLYQLPVPPSPNLPDMASVYLYPSICLFEGTPVSVGRGTMKPFQFIGYPDFREGNISFTPKSLPGLANHPLYEDTLCKGFELTTTLKSRIVQYRRMYLFMLVGMYDSYPDKGKFFNDFFDKLAGTDQLRMQITKKFKEEMIKKEWKSGLENFKLLRKKYLLYEDFE
ncbi:MAG: DUF1343 domain-containing protein [Bacteroidetes bacterium]|nr:DUF1343 domain-containing protein [Bacteroidota bacterium]